MPQPIVAFLQHADALKSAMVECLDTASPKTVHRLRSTTRRMEAALELLIITAGLPALRKKSKAFRKALRKIRRASGHVRDLDVHRELLGAYKKMRDTTRLEEDLDTERKIDARKLQQSIARDQQKILRALAKLEKTLSPVANLDLSGEGVADSARSWLAAAVHGLDLQDDEDLHSIRKACKTGRYIAEIGSEASTIASSLAKRLNGVQKTTGSWHDYLLLLEEVHRSLPEDSPLAGKLHAKAERLRHLAEGKAARLLAA
jgi:CHAD domain-containing protein